ncbi:hypothetical protein FJZ27_01080 [Candidatus Peribacteria bacterium]|nr:hypothetical protein [Candidatus Peribacteria bacterium]
MVNDPKERLELGEAREFSVPDLEVERSQRAVQGEVREGMEDRTMAAKGVRKRTQRMRRDYNQKISAVEDEEADEETSETEKDEKAIMKEQLERGEIPPQLAEAWRLVSPDSMEGRRFQEIAQGLGEHLYAEVKGGEHLPHHAFRQHDFKKQPVRFLLSKDPKPNAWFVRHSNPPIIVFTECLFSAKKGQPLVSTPNDFVAILSHEMTHLKMRQVYGNIPNSKIEEGFAYSFPLILMCEKGKQLGLNPERVLGEDGREGLFNAMKEQSKGTSPWFEYMDVHPSTNNIHSIVSDTLAYLRKEKGTLAPDVPEVGKYSDNDEIIRVVKGASHTSYVQADLSRHPEYAGATCIEKIEILRSVLDDMDKTTWEVRIGDLAAEIRKLGPEVQTPEDRKAVHSFANHVLQFGERDSITKMSTLYSALAGTLYSALGTPPLGRLRRLGKAVKTFVQSIEEYEGDEETVIEAAIAVNELLEGSEEQKGEPFLESSDGLHFLNKIDWPQFDFPDTEKIRRLRRRDGGVHVAWEELRSIAIEHPEVAKAAAYLGLVRDPFMMRALCNHLDLALTLTARMRTQALGDIVGSIATISQGPRDGGTTVDALTFNEDGTVKDVDIGDNIENEEKIQAIFEQYLSGWAEHDFLLAEQDEEAARRLSKISESWAGLSNAKSGQKLGLLCLDVCEKNFQLFLELNWFALQDDRRAARMLISKLESLGEKGTELFRYFLTSKSGEQIILQSLVSTMPLAGIDEGLAARSGGRKKEIRTNPYFDYLLDEKCKALSDEEKISFCDKWLLKEKFSYVSTPQSHFVANVDLYDAKLGEKYVNLIKPQLDKTGHGYEFKPLTWNKLLSLIQEVNGFSEEMTLARSCLYCEAIQLIETKIPTLAQAADFVERMTADLVANSHFQRHLREKLKQRVKNYATNNAKTADLPSAVRQWKLLSKAELLFPETSDEILRILVDRSVELNNGSADANRQCMQMCEELLGGARIQDPKLRTRLIDAWTDSAKKLYGMDKGDAEYATAIIAIADRVRATMNRVDHAEILGSLAKKLETQNHLSCELQKRAYEVTEETFTQSSLYGVFTDATIDNIRRSPDHRKATLDFLTTPLSDDFCERYLDSGKEALEFVDKYNLMSGGFTLKEEDYEEGSDKAMLLAYRKQVALKFLRYFYENFWSSPIEARAVLVRELLVSPEEVVNQVDKETFDYTVSKVFKGGSLYEEEARFFLRGYVDALPHYQKHLCLGAMMAAAEKRGSSDMRLGEALAYFLENMGPAETKFGQAAQSHPLVPTNIREDLKRLKFHASEPARWDVTQWVESARSELEREYNAVQGSQEAAKVSRIGDVVGSGSIYVVVEVEMSDGNSYMLSLLRPDVENRGRAGFETMRRMSDNLELDSGHSIVQTTRELIDQANQRLGLEVDCPLAKQQYGAAREIYRGASIAVDGEQFYFDSADVIVAGEKFFLMSKIQGQHFIELPENNDAEKTSKKRQAMAILAFELNNKLRGRFDCDRHGGNVKVQPQLHKIGHFDFKCMPVNGWTEEGYRQFAGLLLSTLNGEKTVKQFFNDLVEQERLLRERLQSAGSSIDPFVTEVQKGLLTDGEYTQFLEKNDLMRVVISALLNGMHPHMQTALLEAVAARVPEPFREPYRQQIEPAVRHSLATGELTPQLLQFLPMQIKPEEVMRIQRA